MRFLANAGISPKTVRFLSKLGHDAAHIHVGLGTRHGCRDPDPEPVIVSAAAVAKGDVCPHVPGSTVLAVRSVHSAIP
jgi:hypothetical protein